MFKVKLFVINKTKEEWLKAGILEYEKRLTGQVEINWNIFKNELELKKSLDKEKFFILLDEKGKGFNSHQFKNFLFTSFQNHNPLCFVIGADEGLSDEIKSKADILLSLSNLTFTHQMIRLFFLEQLYRSFQIEKNSGYHK